MDAFEVCEAYFFQEGGESRCCRFGFYNCFVAVIIRHEVPGVCICIFESSSSSVGVGIGIGIGGTKTKGCLKGVNVNVHSRTKEGHAHDQFDFARFGHHD